MIVKAMRILLVLLCAALCGCIPDPGIVAPPPPVENPGGDTDNPSLPADPPQTSLKMKITIGPSVFTATLSGNASSRAFRARLPMTVTMNEMNGNEKYYNLPGSLPAAPANPGTIRHGDIMLYGSSTLVIFYKTFTTPYPYTPVGRLDNPLGLEAALGRGSVTVKFELNDE